MWFLVRTRSFAMMRTAACDNNQTVHYSCVHVASCFVHSVPTLEYARVNSHWHRDRLTLVRRLLITTPHAPPQGEVTPTDSVVTTVTTVGQRSKLLKRAWSMVKAHSKIQSTPTTAGRSATVCSLSLECFLYTRFERQALGKAPCTIDGQNCRAVKGQRAKSAWSTVKPLKRAGQNFDPWSQL